MKMGGAGAPRPFRRDLGMRSIRKVKSALLTETGKKRCMDFRENGIKNVKEKKVELKSVFLTDESLSFRGKQCAKKRSNCVREENNSAR